MKVSKLALLVLMTILQQSLALNFVEKIAAGVQSGASAVGKEMSDIGNPIATAISQTAGSQCNVLKNGLRLDYNHTADERASDVKDLPLVYTTPNFQVTFPLHAAATELPRTIGSSIISNANENITTTFSEIISKIILTIFMHGFTDNPSKANFQMVNDAYRSAGVDGVLAVDASELIGFGYLGSSTNVHHIGNGLGEALAELYKIGLVPDNIHLVGHSLGAHICSFTAKRFAELTGEKLGWIFGLDPAGPCFEDVSEDQRLKATDAKHVVAIHSNAGVLGFPGSLGDADFYPNGGSQQPGCVIESCSHSFVVKLFAYSILNPYAFPAMQCDDYDAFTKGNCTGVINYMGVATDPSLKGNFYLQTYGEEPLGKGQDGMTYVNTNGVIKTVEETIIGVFH